MTKIKPMTKMMTGTSLAVALATLFTTAPVWADAREDALEQKLDALTQQVQALKTELKALKAQNEALAVQQEAAPAASSTAAPVAATGVSAQQSADSPLARASLYGYGEIAYSRYDHDSSRTQADLGRAVFGIGYRYDENTRFVSEFEIEHSVASASDEGEFEVEQFYIDHRMADWASLKAGLILIPSGYLNTVHEPPRYYGVYRNFVETAIIPSTEREGGVAVYGRFANGLSYDLGVTTSFNLAKWDFTADGEGRESPLGSVHQELSNAKAADLAQYLAINYDGIRGLNLGGSLFTGEAGNDQPGFNASPRFTLWETHGRYRRGPLELQALYARGSISDTAGVNLANAGSATPIPSDFHGWYLQGAYRVWQNGGYALHPFVRYERYNTADSVKGLPAGVGPGALATETVRTYGASFFLNPNVVLKADYQQFGIARANNRFNLGLGLQF